MRRTKTMYYRETAEATELFMYADNTRRIYDQFMYAVANLNKKVARGVYDPEKAVDLFYYTATAASDSYNREFGYKFSVTDRFTAAVMLRDLYESDYMPETGKPELSVVTSEKMEVKTA